MSAIIIRGGRPLSGSLTVQGAKNSVLPILAATLLSGEVCRIRHCPRQFWVIHLHLRFLIIYY